jgi:hypothetical protein
MKVNYKPYDHRSNELGYPSPKNAQALAKFVFKSLCRKKIGNFYLAGVDNSSTLLASFLIMECHKSKRKNKPTPIFVSGNKHSGGIKYSDSFRPERLPTVYVDDYYCEGTALSYVAGELLKSAKGSKPLLYVFLIEAKTTKEFISELYTRRGMTCEVELLVN